VLDMVGLDERRRSLVRTYSGGMKRRLEIARGLLHAPRVLFLDEPTLGLDPQTRSRIWEYVEDLKRRESITIFLTTHYMDEAEYCLPRLFADLPVSIRSVSVARPTLDDVFMSYTGRTIRDAESSAGERLKAKPWIRGRR